MAEIKEAMPAPQPEALDMPDDEVLTKAVRSFLYRYPLLFSFS